MVQRKLIMKEERYLEKRGPPSSPPRHDLRSESTSAVTRAQQRKVTTAKLKVKMRMMKTKTAQNRK